MSASPPISGRPLPAALLERFRPAVEMAVTAASEPSRVLVLGVYLADVPTNVDDIVVRLGETAHSVTQRWVGIGGPAPSAAVGEVTVATLSERRPKFACVNERLAEVDIADFDYVLVVDDDVVLPYRFLDVYLDLQARLGFAIAQPARTATSFTHLPIVCQQRGVLARTTRFVEVGPLVSFHRSAYPAVFPFDLGSPMGWGYEAVWARRAGELGLTLGILDAVPVEHSLRQTASLYDWEEADQGRTALWRRHEHLAEQDCFVVLDVAELTAPG